MPHVKPRFKNDSLLTNPTLFRVALVQLTARMCERLNFYIFEKQNTQTQVKRQIQLVLVVATADSFSLHGFIDCFNYHIGHAALLQSNAR